MSETQPFRFSRFLSDEEQQRLARTAEWRWISTIGKREVAPVEHARHARWMKVKGNTHAPPIREVMLTFRGEAVHTLDGSIYLRQPGTVMLFNHYESRDLMGAKHKSDFHTLWLHFHQRTALTCNSNSCDARGHYFQEIPAHVIEGPQVELAMEAWDQWVVEPENFACRELLRLQLATLLLSALGREVRSEESLPEESPQQQVVAAVQAYIAAHLADPLPLRALAQIAGYSPFFFHRLFVRYTGKTPVEYVNGARLEQAKRLMAEGYTTQAAAESVGFASVSYFSNLCRRKWGCPPGRFVKR